MAEEAAAVKSKVETELPFDDADDDEFQPPNVLLVQVLQCRNLPAMDGGFLSKGSSDPVVKVSCGGQSRTAKPKYRTLDPVWEGEEAYYELFVEDENEVVEVFVEDWDRWSSNDAIGSAQIKLGSFLKDRARYKRWASLEPLPGTALAKKAAKRKRQAGKRGPEVEVAARWVYRREHDYFCEAMPEEHMRAAPNQLLVCIIQARNLLPMDGGARNRPTSASEKAAEAKAIRKAKNDPNSGKQAPRGSSDPFVTIECGSQRFKTTVVKQTLAPVWCEQFELPVERASDFLSITVQDWDLIGSPDFMGKVTVPLRRLANKSRERKWLTLTDKDGDRGVKRGEVNVAMRWVYNPEYDFFPDEDMSGKPPNELLVALVQARGLPIMDKSLLGRGPGSSDPVCTLQCGSQKFESTVKKKTCHPVWNERFSIPVEPPVDSLTSNVGWAGLRLDLAVEDWDLMSGNDFIGRCWLQLKPLVGKQRERQWLPLKPRRPAEEEQTDLGDVEVVLRWRYNIDLDFFAADDGYPEEPPNELRIAVCQARGLPAMDRSLLGGAGNSDPVCTLRSPTHSFETSVKKKTLHPVWNECFSLPARDASFPLEVLVHDYDDLSGNDFIGKCIVGLGQLRDKQRARRWCDLGREKDGAVDEKVPRGELEIVLRWVYNPQAEHFLDIVPPSSAGKRSAVHDDDDDDSETAKPPPPNELLVAVIQARSLTAMDKKMFGGAGTSDPLVTITCGTQRRKTTVKKKTLNPWYDEPFSLPVDAANGTKGHFLKCVVDDWDLLSGNDFIGQVSMPLERFLDGQRRVEWQTLRPADAPPVSLDNDDDGDATAVACGALELVTKWVYNPLLDYFPDDDGFPDKPPNELHVAVIQGRGLLAVDTKLLGGAPTSDPFLRFACGGQRRKTAVVKGTTDPWWNERFAVPAEVPDPDDDTETPDHVEFVVEDWDMIGANDFMGKVRIDLAALIDKKRHRGWYDLSGDAADDATDRGQLEIAFRWVYNPDYDYFGEPDEYPESVPNELHIALVQAQGLPIMDKNLIGKGGSTDPIVTMRCCGQKRTSAVKKRTLEPWFNEKYEMPCFGMGNSLEVCVYDWDRFGGNDLIGVAVIDVDVLADKRRVRRWIKLRPKDVEDGVDLPDLGEIELVVRWMYDPEQDYFTDVDHHPDRDPNELWVALVQCRDIKPMDTGMFGGPATTSDPMVTLRCGEQKVTSTVKKKTLAPWYNEIFVIPAEEDGLVLEVVVEDWDLLGANDPIGNLAIDLNALKDKRTDRRWHALEPPEIPSESESDDDDDDDEDGSAPASAAASPAATPVEPLSPSVGPPPGAPPPVVAEVCGDEAGTDATPAAGDEAVTDAPLATAPVEEMDDGATPRATFVNAGIGEVELVLRRMYNPDVDYLTEDDGYPNRPPNELRIALVQARGLLPVDTTFLSKDQASTSDPVVSLRCAGQRVKSTTKMKTLFPVWNEMFTLPVYGEGEVLDVLVEDWDLIGSNDFIGMLAIDIDELRDKKRSRKWYTLRDEDGTEYEKLGSVELVLRWQYNPELDYFPDEDDSGREPNQLEMVLVQARDLPAKDSGQKLIGKAGPPSSDPVATITCGPLDSNRWKSEVRKKTLTPSWSSRLHLPCTEATDMVHIAFDDWNRTGGNTPIGSAEVDVASLYQKGVLRGWFPLRSPEDRDSTLVEGEISLGEVAERLWGYSRQHRMRPDELFEKFDADGNAMLDVYEVSLLLAELGYTYEQSEHIFAKVDVSGDGEVDYDEWLEHMRSCGEVELVMRWVYDPDLDVLDFEDDGFAGEPPNEIRVGLLQASGMPIMDKNMFGGGGSSDPVVTFTCAKIDAKSTVKMKTLTPVWNESFTLALGDLDDELGEDMLDIKVEDWDLIGGNDLIGRLSLPLFPMEDKKVYRGWHTLRGEDGEEDAALGRVELMFRCIFNPEREAADAAAKAAAGGGADVTKSLPRWLKRAMDKFSITMKSTEVAMRRVPMSREDSKLFGRVLREPAIAIGKADLRETSLGTDEVVLIADALKENALLTFLNISNNSVFDHRDIEGDPSPNRGLLSLAAGLRVNETLTYLDISECHVEPDGLSELAQGVRHNNALETLKLGRNPLCGVTSHLNGRYSSAGVVALGEAVSHLTRLRTLAVPECQLCGVDARGRSKRGKFRVEAVANLVLRLEQNLSLTEVNLSDNGIAEGGGLPVLGTLLEGELKTAYKMIEKLDRGKKKYLMLRRNHATFEVKAGSQPDFEFEIGFDVGRGGAKPPGVEKGLVGSESAPVLATRAAAPTRAGGGAPAE